MQTRVVQIGNSAGVAIPSKVRQQLKLKKGVAVTLEVTADKSAVIIRPTNGKPQTTVDHDFLRVMDRVNKRYGPALKRLAKE